MPYCTTHNKPICDACGNCLTDCQCAETEPKQMQWYRVIYQSMTATYGPNFIQAESEQQAKEIFGSKAFSRAEQALMRVRPCTPAEIKRALLHSNGDHED